MNDIIFWKWENEVYPLLILLVKNIKNKLSFHFKKFETPNIVRYHLSIKDSALSGINSILWELNDELCTSHVAGTAVRLALSCVCTTVSHKLNLVQLGKDVTEVWQNEERNRCRDKLQGPETRVCEAWCLYSVCSYFACIYYASLWGAYHVWDCVRFNMWMCIIIIRNCWIAVVDIKDYIKKFSIFHIFFME